MFNFINLLFGSTANGDGNSSYAGIIMLVVMVVAMYFLMIRPQKKKEKEAQELRDSIQIGDEVTTIGGIMGRVVTVKDDSVVIETGADRVKMRFQRWAIQTNDTANARMEAERKAAAEAKKAKSEQDAIDVAVGGKKSKKTKKVKNIVTEETDTQTEESAESVDTAKNEE